MIKSIKHKGLKQFFESGDKSGIQTKQAELLEDRLAALDSAQSIQDEELKPLELPA